MPHRKTCKRYNEVGHAHALTFSCFRRQPFLSRDRSRTWLVDAVRRARSRLEFDLWAYVFMPEHVHLLIRPRRTVYDIGGILRTIKRSVAGKALGWVRREAPWFLPRNRQPDGSVHHRFWQRGGGYDRNLMEPATVFLEIDYIHHNPVRRGLCSKPEEWRWSSAADYAGLGSGLLPLDRRTLPVVLGR